MSYSDKERHIANLLSGYPVIKNTIKWAYSYVSSLINKAPSETVIHPGISITDIAPDIEGSTFWGYYDKTCSNKQGYALFHQTKENPYKKNNGVNIYLKDPQGETRRISTSKAWNWQQGAMLTWIDDSSFIFNDFDEEKYVSHVYNIEGKLLDTFAYPIYSINDGKAITLNFSRLAKLRPDYGYFNLPYKQLAKSPHDEGIGLLYLDSGEYRLIISLNDLAAFESRSTMLSAFHKTNHLQFSPVGDKFIFLHRWYDRARKYTRLMIVNTDGSQLKEILAEDMVSHCTWLNNQEIVSWARREGIGDRYFLFNTEKQVFSTIGDGQLMEDGHPSVLNNQWLLTDTYPDPSRMANLILFDLKTSTKYTLGRFYAPMRYWGVNRCDLHPRWNPNGKSITFDSVHSGVRRLYQMDLTSILNRNVSN